MEICIETLIEMNKDENCEVQKIQVREFAQIFIAISEIMESQEMSIEYIITKDAKLKVLLEYCAKIMIQESY